jgi:hypothetical protein
MTVPFNTSASLAGLRADRPAPDPDSIGRFYFAEDETVLYRDNGSDWIALSRAGLGVISATLNLANAALTVLFNTTNANPTVDTNFGGVYYISHPAFQTGKVRVIHPAVVSGIPTEPRFMAADLVGSGEVDLSVFTIGENGDYIVASVTVPLLFLITP